jgi:phosphate transport system ATP-binding protein
MIKIEVKNLDLWYGQFQALKKVNVKIKENRITSIIGPSGCGKSTLIRVFNRMNDQIKGIRMSGKVLIDGKNIHSENFDIIKLRKEVGMVFQKPNPFPLSIFDNISYGPRIHGENNKSKLAEIVKRSLSEVELWEEVKDNLGKSALALTPEQKQRLCIARLFAVESDILLMDEPCSTLDPRSTNHFEELLGKLKKDRTIIIVTHNMQQAARISDDAGFMLLGEMIEFDATSKIFTSPTDKRTNDYITGKFG